MFSEEEFPWCGIETPWELRRRAMQVLIAAGYLLDNDRQHRAVLLSYGLKLRLRGEEAAACVGFAADRGEAKDNSAV